MSLQIKDLEREVGAALFHRVPHGAELTAAGAAFLETVSGMPALAQQGIKLAQRAARGEIGALRVGFTASSAFNIVVPDTLRAFRRAYPVVTLVLEEANTTRLVAGLQEGTLDVAFLRPEPGADRDLTLRILSEEPLLAVLPSSHSAASNEEVALSRLASDPFILHPRRVGPTLYDVIIGACRGAGFEPRIDQVAPQLSSIISLVAAELGVALVPASMQQLKFAGVTFKAIKGPAAATSISLAFRKNSTSHIARNFVAVALRA